MNTGLLLSLAGLALIDSTSIGTLFIPAWLLLSPGTIRVPAILTYLATIAAFYFGVGLLLATGAQALTGTLDGAQDNPALRWGELVLGAGLLAFSFSPRFDSKRESSGSGRIRRWRERAMSGTASTKWLAGLALLAALAEVATMLPYLAAIGMLTAADLAGATVALILAGYCVIMVLPAVGLLVVRLASAERVEPLLQRMDRWVSTKGANAMGWIIGIAGFLIARDAAAHLFPGFS